MHFQSVGCTPGVQMAPPVVGSKQLVYWTSETLWKCEKCRSSTGLSPASYGYGPSRILAVCRHNLWPAVRMELGQEEWLRLPQNREQREPIVASDQGSCQGHHCSETALTGNPSPKVWVAPPGREPLPPVAGGKRLVHWISETWWKCEKWRSSTVSYCMYSGPKNVHDCFIFSNNWLEMP